MGLFGKPGYLKDGPGIEKDAPKKNHFVYFFELLFRKFGKLMNLNMLYFLFWIPLFAFVWIAAVYKLPTAATLALYFIGFLIIGPGTAGFMAILIKHVREEPNFMLHDFMKALKENLKFSLIAAAIDFVMFVMLSIVIPFYFNGTKENPIYWALFAVVMFMATVTVFANYYLFPMIVTLNLGIKDLLKNSFYFSILAAKTNICTTFFCALVLIPVFLFMPLTMLIMPFIVMSLVGFIICYNSWPKIKQYCVDPYYAEQAGELGENGGEDAEDEGGELNEEREAPENYEEPED